MPRQLLVQVDRPSAQPGAETWQLLVPFGRWSHPKYGTVDHTPERVKAYHDNFQAGLLRQGEDGRLPFGIDHHDGLGAAGWIKDTRLTDGGLEARVSWTPQGVKAIAEEEYPFVSPDILDDFQDPETQRQHTDVLKGASLVMRPFFKRLPQVTLKQFADSPEPTVLWEDLSLLQRAAATEDFTMDLEAQTETTDEQVDETTDEVTEDEVRTPLTEQTGAANEAADDDASADSDAASADAAEGEKAFADQVDGKAFADMQAKVYRLELEQRTRQYRDELAGHSFGDRGRLAPGPRDKIAEILAKLPATEAAELVESIKAMRFYEPGVLGLEDERPAKQFSDDDRAFMARHGLTEEDYEAIG